MKTKYMAGVLAGFLLMLLQVLSLFSDSDSKNGMGMAAYAASETDTERFYVRAR